MAGSGDDYWGKGGNSGSGSGNSSKDPGGEFWNKAQVSKREADQLAGNPDLAAERKRNKRRRRRNIGWGVVGALLLAAGAAVLFAPQIASSMAPGLVKSKSAELIAGSATVESVSLSWTGPQKFNGVTLIQDGKPIAVVSLSTSAGLLGLARGNLDLGDVVISDAKADVVRNKDGTTNIQRAVALRKPPAAGSGSGNTPAKDEPASLPAGLKANIVIEALQASFTDLSQPPLASGLPSGVTLRKFKGGINVATGEPLDVKLSGDAYEGAVPTGKVPTGTPGTIAIDVKLSDWCSETGEITTRTAKAKAAIELKGLPVALADAFAPMQAATAGGVAPSFAKALGSRIDVSLKANGQPNNMTGVLTATADNLSASADVAWKDGFIVTNAPLTASVKGVALSELVPAIKQSLSAQSQATVDALPDVAVTVRQFRMPFANNGKAMDLGGTSADLSVSLSAMTGTVSLAPGEPAKPFVMAPLELKVVSTDLAKGVTANAQTNLTVGGQKAGEIAIDVTSGGVLDFQGAPIKGLPPNLQGSASIKGMATAIAQPFVQTSGIDLATDVGPTLDLDVRANSEAASASDAGAPPTNITLNVRSQNVNASGGFRVESRAIRSGADGLTIQVGSIGNIASRFVKPETGWSVAAVGPSPATISIPELLLNRDEKGAFVLATSKVKAALSFSGLSARSLNAPAEAPIDISSFTLNTLLNDGDAFVTLDSALAHQGKPFAAKADVKVVDIMATNPAVGASPIAPVETLRPEGFIEITGMPLMMTNVFMPPVPAVTGRLEETPEGVRFTIDAPVSSIAAAQPETRLPNPPSTPAATTPQPTTPGSAPAASPVVPAKAGMNIGQLLTSSIGPTMDTRIESKPGAKTGQIDLAVTAKADRLDTAVGASVSREEVALKRSRAVVRVTPETVQGLLREFAPDVKGMPRLVSPGSIELAIDPLLIPLDANSKPILNQVGIAKVSLTAPQPILVEGLMIEGPDGQPRDVGRLGLEGLSVVIEAPVAAFVSAVGLSDRKVTATMAAAIVGASNAQLARLTGDVDAEISEGKLAGGSVANVQLSGVDTGALERILGKDGMLSGTLGRTADASLSAKLSPPVGGKPADLSASDIDLTASLTAPNVDTTGPLKISVTPTRMRLVEPARFVLRIAPALANTYLNPPPKAGEPERSAAATLNLTEPAVVTLSLDKLVMPKSGGTDKFDASTSLTIPKLAFATGDGHVINVDSTEFRAITDSTKANPPLTFRLESKKVSVDGKAANEPVLFQGQIDDLVDSTGGVSTEKATLSAGGRLGGVPTALIDALAKKQGLLVDALGEFVTTTIEARKVPLKGFGTAGAPDSSVSFVAESPRAKATLKGNLNSTVFSSVEPVTVSVDEIIADLAARYMGSMPVLKKLEKIRGQRPATVRAEGLTVPLDNNMRNFNGKIDLDPGELNFQLNPAINKLVGDKVFKEEGFLGQNLKPVRLDVREGIATVQRYELPLGEFIIQAEGTVDLVQEQVDIVTWIPATLLADEVLVGIVDKLGVPVSALSNVQSLSSKIRTYIPLMPYRTRGPIKNPKAELVPDFDLIRQEFQKNGGVQKLTQELLGDQVKDRIKIPGLDNLKIPGLGDKPVAPPK